MYPLITEGAAMSPASEAPGVAAFVQSVTTFLSGVRGIVAANGALSTAILAILTLGAGAVALVVLRRIFRWLRRFLDGWKAPPDFHVKDWRIISGEHIRNAAMTAARYLRYLAGSGLAGLVIVGLVHILTPGLAPQVATIVGGVWRSLLAVLVWLLGVRFAYEVITSLLSLMETRATEIRPLAVRSFTILSAPMVRRGILLTIRVLGWALLVLSLMMLVAVVLRFFQFTWRWSQAIFGFMASLLHPVLIAVVDYIPKLFFAVVIIIIARVILRLLKSFFTEIGEGRLGVARFDREWAPTTYKLLRIIVVIFAFVMVFPYIPGSGSEAFRSVAVFLGVLLSLGSSSLVGNIMAGISLTYMSPYRVGDRVKIGETVGDVTEKTLLVTRVRTIKNVVVTIPNSVVLSAEVENFTSRAGSAPLLLHTAVTIGYNVPWRSVHEALLRAAANVSRVLTEPRPFVLQTALSDYSVRYELNASTADAGRMVQTYSDLHGAIQDSFAEAGIEILTPAYTAFRDGNESTLPAAPRAAARKPKKRSRA